LNTAIAIAFATEPVHDACGSRAVAVVWISYPAIEQTRFVFENVVDSWFVLNRLKLGNEPLRRLAHAIIKQLSSLGVRLPGVAVVPLV